MAVLSKGQDFSSNEQVTSTKLDNLVDAAKFVNTSGVAVANSGNGTCVSDGGLEISSSTGQLQIASDGVTTAKILNSNVTKAKIENVANMKALGNTSGSATAPQEVSILDEDNMTSNSNTALATQQSIKAYVDANSGGSGGYNLYRTVDARNGENRLTWLNWSANLAGTTNLGSWGTGSSGVDQPFIFTFSTTGTYLIEFNGGIDDNDTTSNRSYGFQLVKTSNGSTFLPLTATTNTGGSGGLVTIKDYAGYNQSLSTGAGPWGTLSLVYIVGNTSDQNLVVYSNNENASSSSTWEGSGLVKVTKLP